LLQIFRMSAINMQTGSILLTMKFEHVQCGIIILRHVLKRWHSTSTHKLPNFHETAKLLNKTGFHHKLTSHHLFPTGTAKHGHTLLHSYLKTRSGECHFCADVKRVCLGHTGLLSRYVQNARMIAGTLPTGHLAITTTCTKFFSKPPNFMQTLCDILHPSHGYSNIY
jgi:hypothetical protein